MIMIQNSKAVLKRPKAYSDVMSIKKLVGAIFGGMLVKDYVVCKK